MSQEGGTKHDNNKPSISLVPSSFILGIGSVFNFGGAKYGLHNYRQGLKHSRCIDAAIRHLLAILDGEEVDNESGLLHIHHAGCSLAMYDYQRVNHPELNDIHELLKKKGVNNG